MIDTKLFRQKILDIAIKGKLVPQDPSDEPASVLLERIRKEKAELVKQGKIKKDKQDSFIFTSDNRHYENVGGKVTDITEQIPFEVPKGWAWCRAILLLDYAQRDKSPKYTDIKKYPVLA
jgi:type I restriction enzyme S subunit